MSYSYQKQIERLLNFVQLVKQTTSVTTIYNEACKLLNDEPVRLNSTAYGLLETPRERKAPERKYNYPRYF